MTEETLGGGWTLPQLELFYVWRADATSIRISAHPPDMSTVVPDYATIIEARGWEAAAERAKTMAKDGTLIWGGS